MLGTMQGKTLEFGNTCGEKPAEPIREWREWKWG